MDTIKLCNFALSRDLPLRSSSARPGKSYRMTGMVGTPRYMAPEVALGNKYSTSCDVYSFAMVFAYMISGERPYENYPSVELLKHFVWESSYPARPELGKSMLPSPALHIMLKKAWSKEIMSRPKAGELKLFLWHALKVKPLPKSAEPREWIVTGNGCPCCQRNSDRLMRGEIRVQNATFEEEPAPFFVASKENTTSTTSPQWSPYGEKWSL